MDIVLLGTSTRYSEIDLNYSNEPSIVIDWLTTEDLAPTDALVQHVYTEYTTKVPTHRETLETIRQALTVTEEDIEAAEEYDTDIAELKIRAISGWLPEAHHLIGQPVTIIALYTSTDPYE